MSILYSKIRENLEKKFSNFHEKIARNIVLISVCILDSGAFSTHQIATSMSKMLDINFHSSENRLSRFLGTKSLEIGAKTLELAYRNLINLSF